MCMLHMFTTEVGSIGRESLAFTPVNQLASSCLLSTWQIGTSKDGSDSSRHFSLTLRQIYSRVGAAERDRGLQVGKRATAGQTHASEPHDVVVLTLQHEPGMSIEAAPDRDDKPDLQLVHSLRQEAIPSVHITSLCSSLGMSSAIEDSLDKHIAHRTGKSCTTRVMISSATGHRLCHPCIKSQGNGLVAAWSPHELPMCPPLGYFVVTRGGGNVSLGPKRHLSLKAWTSRCGGQSMDKDVSPVAHPTKRLHVHASLWR
jgi:hypothetical protein